MSLRQCKEQHTYREYLAWRVWLDKQWNQPSRSDNYMMQTATEVARVLAKDPKRIKMEHFKLKFSRRKQETEQKITKEEATKRSKAAWQMRLHGVKTQNSSGA